MAIADRDILRLLEHVTASAKAANDSLDDALSFIAESNKRIKAIMRSRNKRQESGDD